MYRDNLRFLTEKEAALRQLSAALSADIAARHRDALSSPPAPEEIARLWESLGGDAAGFPSFCRAFSGAYRDRAASVFSDSDEEQDAAARIAYLRSSYSDQAYRRFSALFGHVTASYFPGFREVAEEVYAGRATHAILPVWNSSDGALLTFRRLLSRYDLKIAAASDISAGDESVVRFALVRRGLPKRKTPPAYLELSVVPGDGMTPGAFLSACESLGAAAVSVSAHPTESGEGRDALDIRLDLTRADTAALYLYLEGSHARYETIGSYDMI
ncbi:MAG: hypothetical protein II889_08345 [Clostridia bacterium]|nr:hypothetical protein [Clostridia bacterium]